MPIMGKEADINSGTGAPSGHRLCLTRGRITRQRISELSLQKVRNLNLGLGETRGAGARRADSEWHACVKGHGVTRKEVEEVLASVAIMAVPRL